MFDWQKFRFGQNLYKELKSFPIVFCSKNSSKVTDKIQAILNLQDLLTEVNLKTESFYFSTFSIIDLLIIFLRHLITVFLAIG